jgi:hypothetical protein
MRRKREVPQRYYQILSACKDRDLNLVKDLVTSESVYMVVDSASLVNEVCRNGCKEIAEYFIDIGFEILPCHLQTACKYGKHEIVLLILKHEKTINKFKVEDFYSLLKSVKRRQERITDILLETGIDVNEQEDLSSSTALHIAASNYNHYIFQALIDHGGDVNHQNSFDRTPLHVAVSKTENHEAIKFLLENGANPLIQDFELKFASDLAIEDDVKEMLIKIQSPWSTDNHRFHIQIKREKIEMFIKLSHFGYLRRIPNDVKASICSRIFEPYIEIKCEDFGYIIIL